MGVIKGFLVVIASVLLFLSLFSMTSFAVISSSLNYENVEAKSAPMIRNLLEDGFTVEGEIDSVTPAMQAYCKINPNMEYVFRAENYTFDIPCDVAVQGKDAIIDEAVRDLISGVYYTEYDCSFFPCFTQSPFFLVSQQSYDYMNSKFYFFLFASIILFIALFFFIEKKTNTFMIAGGSLIISSLIFTSLSSVFSSSNQMLFQLLGIFFSESFPVSVKIFAAGIILIAVGIVFKIFKIGFKIEEFMEKFKKSSEDFRKKQNVKILPQPKLPSKKSVKFVKRKKK